jgi:hypothetical protein
MLGLLGEHSRTLAQAVLLDPQPRRLANASAAVKPDKAGHPASTLIDL